MSAVARPVEWPAEPWPVTTEVREWCIRRVAAFRASDTWTQAAIESVVDDAISAFPDDDVARRLVLQAVVEGKDLTTVSATTVDTDAT